MTKYQLGTRVFKRKEDIRKYFKTYLQNNDACTYLTGEYKSAMSSLIKWHPNYDETWDTNFRIMPGIKNTKAFANDNGIFSYGRCVDRQSQQKNNAKILMSACRHCIHPDIKQFKLDNLKDGRIRCSIDGNYYNPSDIHTDHDFDKITFKELVNNWELLHTDTIKIISINEGGHTLDEPYKSSWINYHRKHAILRNIFKTYNLRGN